MKLTASERTKLIREITQRLSNDDWSLVDVALRQFGVSTPDSWGGAKDAYILRSIQDCADSILLELADHLGFQLGKAVPPLELAFWRPGMLKVFVSHLAAHRKLAAELQEGLSRFGISCFVAHNDIEPTREWQDHIELALSTCDAMIALLHPEFHQSKWTDQEIGYALGRDIPVFSVRLGQDPYGFIGRFQGFDGLGKPAKTLAQELFRSYAAHKRTSLAMARALVAEMEQSGSFAVARENMDYLMMVEAWEPALSDRLQSALESNDQISKAWGVPEKIQSLLSKWKA